MNAHFDLAQHGVAHNDIYTLMDAHITAACDIAVQLKKRDINGERAMRQMLLTALGIHYVQMYNNKNRDSITLTRFTTFAEAALKANRKKIRETIRLNEHNERAAPIFRESPLEFQFLRILQNVYIAGCNRITSDTTMEEASTLGNAYDLS